MTKTLREVAKVLYEVENSLCCKICVRCKEKEDNKHLSCVDCIEEGLQKLVERATPMKPILYDLYDDGDNDFVFDANGNLEDSYACCPNCKKQDIYDFEYGVCFKHCTNCGQKLDWRKE